VPKPNHGAVIPRHRRRGRSETVSKPAIGKPARGPTCVLSRIRSFRRVTKAPFVEAVSGRFHQFALCKPIRSKGAEPRILRASSFRAPDRQAPLQASIQTFAPERKTCQEDRAAPPLSRKALQEMKRRVASQYRRGTRFFVKILGGRHSFAYSGDECQIRALRGGLGHALHITAFA